MPCFQCLLINCTAILIWFIENELFYYSKWQCGFQMLHLLIFHLKFCDKFQFNQAVLFIIKCQCYSIYIASGHLDETDLSLTGDDSGADYSSGMVCFILLQFTNEVTV